MKHLKIQAGLFLVEQEVARAASKVNTAPTGQNHLFIIDRSGSMHGKLEQLGEDLIKQANKLTKGDTVTFGWFSSEGQFNFVLKGFRINDGTDNKILETVIRQNLTTIGCTCFSEILQATDQVIKDLAVFSPDFTLMFLTDGYPVVSNYQREITNIFAAIAKIEGRIDSALLVGYGEYYNKELMTKMAQSFGGSLCHSSNLEQFQVSLAEFLVDSQESGRKEALRVEQKSSYDVYFGINGRSITLFQESNGTVNFIPTRKGRNSLYILSDKVHSDSEEIDFSEVRDGKTNDAKSFLKALYGASFLLTQRTKTDTALELLGALGDVALIDAITNAFTNTEYGNAEAAIKKACTVPTQRFTKGMNSGYLPPADAFCVLDAIDLLAGDKEARFFPYHKDFKYNRIGTKTNYKEDVNEFIPVANPSSELLNLTWNDKKLNLSILCKIDGHVKLPADEAKALGFADQYPTFIYRNYAAVKDGHVNIDQLPIAMSQSTFNTLCKHGLIDALEYQAGQAYLVNLNRIPVMNRSMAQGKTSAKQLCENVWAETQLEAKIKAVKGLIGDLGAAGVEVKLKTALTSVQEAFLLKYCVGKNGYEAPTEKDKPIDFYMAKEFEIKIKGFSSLPKVADVQRKLKENAKLTPAEEALAAGLTLVEATLDNKAKLLRLQAELANLQGQLRAVRRVIQRVKFSIILAKKWFDEFTSREENTLTIGERLFTISLREVKVNI